MQFYSLGAFKSNQVENTVPYTTVEQGHTD